MSYPVIPHPKVVTASGTTARVTYANTGRSAYAKLASGVRTFVTRTIPNFARRLFSGLYQVAKYAYHVTKAVATGTVKFTWRLAGLAANYVKKIAKQVPNATRKGAEAVGKVVGGTVRRVSDFNRGLAKGIAGDASNYVPHKYRDKAEFDKLDPSKQVKVTARAGRRQKTVEGIVRRAVLGAEVSGGLKLISKSIENMSNFDIMSLHGVNVRKEKRG